MPAVGVPDAPRRELHQPVFVIPKGWWTMNKELERRTVDRWRRIDALQRRQARRLIPRKGITPKLARRVIIRAMVPAPGFVPDTGDRHCQVRRGNRGLRPPVREVGCCGCLGPGDNVIA